MSLNFQQSRQLLQDFDFANLFIEVLGWSNPSSAKPVAMEIEGETYQRKMVAELSGVVVLEVTTADGKIPEAKVRRQVHKAVAELHLENLLIFVDKDRTQSLWYWVKRDGKKLYPREHIYVKGQPGDLFLGKISALVVDFAELEDGLPSVVAVAQKLQQGLDVERVTKRFFDAFQKNLADFMPQIEGIENEEDRRWYASVILNRLMFVYFLQRKQFIDGDVLYLQSKLALVQGQGRAFYQDFLLPLFFEGFAKPEYDREEAVKTLLGQVKYLNGGLFLKHRIEQRYPNIEIPNGAFEAVFELFRHYDWNLDDTPGGDGNEINPGVLGYIFEKYINQKEFGAYYTRPEITEYLCDRTINQLILDKVKAKGKTFESIGELTLKLDADLCTQLLNEILPKLSLLDPACGSGAFLVAAMKTLINIYSAVIGRVKFLTDRKLTSWLSQVEIDHPSLLYYIKKRIITDNLYGVDIMEEATEIAKLRLFLALVASAQAVEDLEPLPNIDFNIMAGNSLIGLIRVDEEGFDKVSDTAIQKAMQRGRSKQAASKTEVVLQGDLLQAEKASQYRKILKEKNRSIALYKEKAFALEKPGQEKPKENQLWMLRSSIEELNRGAQEKLNQLLLDEFSTKLGIKYEEAQLTGKPKKRLLTKADIEVLEPFHWGYHFDQIIRERGGFDAIIANPPYEVFQTDEKEFFRKFSDVIKKKKTSIIEFIEHRDELLEDPEIRKAWLNYCSTFPHQNLYFKKAQQYKNQTSVSKGKKVPSKNNLSKLFLEQCFNLLSDEGRCGIIMPTSIYVDGGVKQLREMLFSECKVDKLFALSNEKFIFEGVHHGFKFCLLTFLKGEDTEFFEAAFRINPREAIKPSDLEVFLNDKEDHVVIPVSVLRRLSPDFISVPEFRSKIDLSIAEKLAVLPMLGEELSNTWNLRLTTEFDKTATKDLFRVSPSMDSLVLYEGRMVHHFTHTFASPQYYIDSLKGKEKLSGKLGSDAYLDYRLVHRRVTGQVNERTLISSIIPKNCFCDNSVNFAIPGTYSKPELVFICAILCSFVFDFQVRNRLNSNVTIGLMNQLSVPRLQKGDRHFSEIVERAAKLICTAPEFDDLAQEVGIGSHHNGITYESERAKLRAELDGMIAHLYNLTENEFAHILSTFPIVPEPVKIAALNAYRDAERGLIK